MEPPNGADQRESLPRHEEPVFVLTLNRIPTTLPPTNLDVRMEGEVASHPITTIRAPRKKKFNIGSVIPEVCSVCPLDVLPELNGNL